jgi:hypothetical protein
VGVDVVGSVEDGVEGGEAEAEAGVEDPLETKIQLRRGRGRRKIKRVGQTITGDSRERKRWRELEVWLGDSMRCIIIPSRIGSAGFYIG